MLQAAFSHRGIAVLDVISPCVTFNDHEGSTKSYNYIKEHHAMLHTPDFIANAKEITVDYEPGTVQEITFEDGNRVLLRKLDVDYDATDRSVAMRVMHEARSRGELVTGLLFVDTSARDLCSREGLSSVPLAQLREDDLRPSRDQWDTLMESFK